MERVLTMIKKNINGIEVLFPEPTDKTISLNREYEDSELNKSPFFNKSNKLFDSVKSVKRTYGRGTVFVRTSDFENKKN